MARGVTLINAGGHLPTLSRGPVARMRPLQWLVSRRGLPPHARSLELLHRSVAWLRLDPPKPLDNRRKV